MKWPSTSMAPMRRSSLGPTAMISVQIANVMRRKLDVISGVIKNQEIKICVSQDTKGERNIYIEEEMIIKMF